MPTKTGKKNFKDFTGTRFKDLIMPLVLGGVGSYSRSAGRGVGLGLEAFRTFKAGQAMGDERDAGKASSEHFQNIADDLRSQAETLETRKSGIYGEQGPMFTDIQEQIIGDRDAKAAADLPESIRNPKYNTGDVPAEDISPAEQFMNDRFGADTIGQGFANEQNAQAKREALLVADGGTEEQAAAAEQERIQFEQTEMIPAAAEQYSQALIDRKVANEDTAEKLGFINRQVRFYDNLAVLGLVNPSSAGYAAAQNHLAEEKRIGQMKYLAETHKLDAVSRADKSKIAFAEMMQRHDNTKAEELQRQAADKYRFFQHEDKIITIEKANPENIRINKIKATEEDMKALTFQQKIGAYEQAYQDYAKALEDARDFGSEGAGLLKAAKDNFDRWYKVMSTEDGPQYQAMFGRPMGPPPVPKTPEQLAAEAQAEAQRQQAVAAQAESDLSF